MKVDERELVIPGELLSESGDRSGDNTYKMEGKIYSKRFGMASSDREGRIKVVPLSGAYLPKVGDKIIGKVEDILMSGWRVDTNSPYSAVLNIKDATSRFIKRGERLDKILDIGDYIIVKIFNVTTQNLVDITMKEPGLRKACGGRIIYVNPERVPRVIGKKGSMVSMIKNTTKCEIVAGQNGVVWIMGDDPKMELLAERAIKMINERSYIKGLTNKVEVFLKDGI